MTCNSNDVNVKENTRIADIANIFALTHITSITNPTEINHITKIYQYRWNYLHYWHLQMTSRHEGIHIRFSCLAQKHRICRCCAWKSHAGFFHVHGNIPGTCHFDWVLNIIVLENFWQRLLIFVELYYTLFESFYYILLLFFHLFILGMFKISSPNCINRTKTFTLFCHFLSNMCILLSFFSIEIYTTVITWNLVTFSLRNWIVYHFIRPYKIFTFNISWMFSFL